MSEVTVPDNCRASFVLSSRLEVLDLYGVPYELAGTGSSLNRLSAPDGRVLVWPSDSGVRGWTTLAGIPLFAPVVPDEAVDRLLPDGFQWEESIPVCDQSGNRISSVRRAGDGSVFLPFDPNRAAQTLLSEEYLELISHGSRRAITRALRSAYYRVRPGLPRRMQIALRRRFTRIQQRSSFPDWPAETALHDLREWLLALIQEVVGHPLPQIGWWPGDAGWAVVLTHDVERSRGYAVVDELVELERRVGLRSAWYFVPERDYRVDSAMIERLVEDGFEVCVHGLRHDGRDLQPGVFEKRLPAMRAYAELWHATGFRAPSTQRSRDLIARLGFEHDSSYSDVARFEPQGGGSCSWLPYFIDDIIELPITLPMDHTLFELLGQEDEAVWVEKAALIREREGMALLLTHPDYMLGEESRLPYERFLTLVSQDRTAWHALPRDVSDWWRRRAASRMRWHEGAWVVEGPAAPEASVIVRDRRSPFDPARTRSILSTAAGR